jgi:hypothetical protein
MIVKKCDKDCVSCYDIGWIKRKLQAVSNWERTV